MGNEWNDAELPVDDGYMLEECDQQTSGCDLWQHHQADEQCSQGEAPQSRCQVRVRLWPAVSDGECGQKIRLEHLSTHRNLHSHHFSSPLSSQQEISAFGEGGHGDTGDVWTVMCEGDYWTRDNNMMLKHADTGMFLSASGHTFGRPIQGQMEIVGQSRPDGSTQWRTQEGVYVHQTDFDPKRRPGHDEL